MSKRLTKADEDCESSDEDDRRSSRDDVGPLAETIGEASLHFGLTGLRHKGQIL